MMNELKQITALSLFGLGVLVSPQAVSTAEACGGSAYSPAHIELTSDQLFGVEAGFLVELRTYEGEDSRPSSLDDIANFNATLNVSLQTNPQATLMGSLSVPEHDPRPGIFLWTPTNGPLSGGPYRVSLDMQGDLDDEVATLSVVDQETLESSGASLSAIILQEVQRGVTQSCCLNLDFEACSEEAVDNCQDPEERCREICWDSARRYAHRLSVELSWSASVGLRAMSHVRLISDLGEESVNDLSVPPTLFKRLEEGESLPDEVCAHLQITHMITGEQLELPERCLSSSDYVSAPRAPLNRESYSDSELDDWLTCDELTPAQRDILISAGKLEGTQRDTQEGCQQGDRRLSWAVALCALIGLGLRRRAALFKRI